MKRWFLAMVAAVIGMTTATAGPLDWSYTATLSAANGSDYLLIGSQLHPLPPSGDTWAEHYFLVPVGEYQPKSGTVYPGSSDMLFGFSPGGPLEIVTTLPPGVTPTPFEVTLTLTDGEGNSTIVRETGSVSATGLLTSGTGNFNIGFNGEHDVTLGGRRARVTFGQGAWSESGVYTTFAVNELSPSETPEPGTLILGGIALAGGVGAWLRRRK